MTRVVLAVLVAVASLIGVTRYFAVRAAVPDAVGLRDGALSPCGPRPNCASSSDGGTPFTYTDGRASARDRLVALLEALPRAAVVTVRDDYVHATARSRLFGFVDDLEFHFPADTPVVHYRSAARWGHSDLGVNAKRIATLRAGFDAR